MKKKSKGIKCPNAKKGDDCFDKLFKNKGSLAMHLTYKHKKEETEEEETEEEETEELSKKDLGLNNNEELEEKEEETDPKPIGQCSDCGHILYEKVNKCPNCEVALDGS